MKVDGTYTGVKFYVASQDANPTGITWDGAHFWVVGSSSDKVYKYEEVIGVPTEMYDIVKLPTNSSQASHIGPPIYTRIK